jgi:hypothetical protein
VVEANDGTRRDFYVRYWARIFDRFSAGIGQGGHLRHGSNRDSLLWYNGPAAERLLKDHVDRRIDWDLETEFQPHGEDAEILPELTVMTRGSHKGSTIWLQGGKSANKTRPVTYSGRLRPHGNSHYGRSPHSGSAKLQGALEPVDRPEEVPLAERHAAMTQNVVGRR